LSNLDAVLREQMRFEIRSLQQRLGITGVYVTHSQDEALVLSDQIAVMRDGVIEQRGAPLEIYNVPRTEFVANFIGLANILAIDEARCYKDVVEGRLANGQPIAARAGATHAVAAAKSQAKVCVRPVDIRLGQDVHTEIRASPTTNRVDGTVRSVTFTGGLVDYFVALDGPEDVVVRIQGTPPIAAKQGDRVVAHFATDRTVVLEA